MLRDTHNRHLIGLVGVTALCIAAVCYTAFPGWLSNDSLDQYMQAKQGSYNDWQPVFLSWWWSRLLVFGDGPGPLFLQIQTAYWGAWFLLSLSLLRSGRGAAMLVPLLGLWPALSFPLGHVWKDIFFGAHMFLAWALVIWSPRIRWWTWIAVMLLAGFAVGSKTNGIVALPFLLGALALKAGWPRWPAAGWAVLLTAVAFIAPEVSMQGTPIWHVSQMQYVQSYDVLAVSVATRQNLLPTYMSDKVGSSPDVLEKLYWPGGNGPMFYATPAGNISTADPHELAALQAAWIKSIVDYPLVYIQHRLANFMSLMRIGYWSAAYVAAPAVPENTLGFTTRRNVVADALVASTAVVPWLYFPWIYLLALMVAAGIAVWRKKNRTPALLVAASAAAFVAPHLFVAPANDFRYLYYAYLCAALCLILTIGRHTRP